MYGLQAACANSANVFTCSAWRNIIKIHFVFFDNKPSDDDNEYIQILGRQNNERVYKWIRRDYIINHVSLSKYKVFVSASNGASGTLGEEAARMISAPIIGTPFTGSTETFLTIGCFDTKE